VAGLDRIRGARPSAAPRRQWQTTDDSGSDAINPSVHDQIHGIGAQIGYTVPQWRLFAAAKYLYQYYAEDRFKGQEFTLTVGYQFF
jgi:hypothetical protein